MLELFLDTLGEGAIGKLASKESTQQKSITPYRQRVYEPSIQSWENIVATIADIEKQYTSLRDPKSKDTMRSAIILTIKALQAELVSEADIRKIIIIARHAETESDKK